MKFVFVLFVVPCAMAMLDQLQPCHTQDAACLRRSAQALVPVVARGVPELGVRSLDPMRLPRVAAKQAGLSMEFTNTDVKGLRKCLVLGLKRVGDTIHLDIKCSVQLTGDYRLSGTLMVFEVSGNDKYRIRIRDIVLHIVMRMSERSLRGQTHWAVDSWSQSHEVRGHARFNFKNMFDGKNPELANAVHQIANEQWPTIVRDVAPPIVDAVVGAIIAEIEKIFDQVPASELSLD